ncbi:MAG: translocation/assembly module TamB [Bacteroidales bacterium]|nr:translocation/assembly module TamB [Bacteroidales bacterium]
MIWFRLKRTLSGLIFWLLHYILLIAILLQLPSVQTFLTRKAIDYVAKTYDLKVDIKKIYVKFPSKIVFGDVFLADNNGDTLIYADEMFTRIAAIKVLDSKVYIDRITFKNAFVNMYIDTAGVNNLDFLLEKFSSDDTSSGGGFDLFCNEFEFEYSRFKYRDYAAPTLEKGFNASDIDLDGINVWISDFQMYGDTIELDLNELNFWDKSGLTLDELSAHIIYNPKGLIMNDFVFRTDESILLSRSLSLQGSDDEWMSDPFNKLSVDISIDSCHIAFSDIALFMPDIMPADESFAFSGHIKGKLSDVKLKDLNFAYADNTRLYADISLNNLPNPDDIFMFADISAFSVSTIEAERLMQCFTNDSTARLPKNIHSLGTIRYQGNITGMLSDVVSFGSLSSDAGSLKTDLAFTMDSEMKNYGFSGKVEMYDIQLGKILADEETFGAVTLKASVDGKADNAGNFDISLESKIDYLGLMGYTYQNIDVNGDFSNDLYMGELLVNDRNLKLNLSGNYNTGMGTPIAVLNMEVDANLGEILVDTSLHSTIKMKMAADFRGELTESVVGKLLVDDMEMSYGKHRIDMEALRIQASEDNAGQHLSVRSDYLDANIDGKYNFVELAQYFGSLAGNYLPVFIGSDLQEPEWDKNTFAYTISLKSLNKLTQVFLPNLDITDDINIDGKIESGKHTFTANSDFPEIRYDSISVGNSRFEMVGSNSNLKIQISTKSINTDHLNLLNNLDLTLSAENDSVFLGLQWDDRGEVDYSGDFSLSAIFRNERPDAALPVIYATIYDSEINIDNKNWKIGETPIKIDSTEIAIEDFVVTYGNQSLRVAGFISENREKLLRFYIENTQLNNINPIIAETGYSLDGVLTASGRFSGLYENPLFKISASVDQLQVNKEKFGRFDVTADWLNNQQGLRLMGSNPFLKFNGNYLPSTDSLNMTVDIDNFKFKVLEPYLNTVEISNTKGFIDGSIHITGKPSDPQVNGFLDFERAQLTYDYLKLYANLNDTVWITPNSILFNKFTVKDAEDNVGIVNGGVYHNKFDDIKFRFDINAKKLKMMNTTEVDNSLFYGTAYGTGSIQVQGNLSAFGIDVTVKTEPGTTFVLPMTESYEASENTILTFIKKENPDDDITSLTEKESDMSYYLNMDIELTPDAEAQIVFDPKVGDMIKANCRGNLNIYYDSNEDFKMIGEVEVVKGSYLFTLENIINKRFEVEEGGTIVWNGDPYDAVMNLNAVYRLRAPLWDLMMAIDSSSTYKKLTNIECHINMSGSLMTPDITFDIRIPNADEKVLSQINNMSADEKNKQLLYLLIMNRFFTPENMRTDYAQQRSGSSAVGNTASELLSNQLSNWLSQISKDFDIGVKYRPGDEISSQELEVALSTQLLNDRILLNGNLGVGQHQSQTSDIVGDVEVQVKINKKGNLRVKGFTRANNDINMEYGPYTNGFGIFFTDDFNTVGELFRKMFRWFIPDKEKDNNKTSKDKKTKTVWPHETPSETMLLNSFFLKKSG